MRYIIFKCSGALSNGYCTWHFETVLANHILWSWYLVKSVINVNLIVTSCIDMPTSTFLSEGKQCSWKDCKNPEQFPLLLGCLLLLQPLKTTTNNSNSISMVQKCLPVWKILEFVSYQFRKSKIKPKISQIFIFHNPSRDSVITWNSKTNRHSKPGLLGVPSPFMNGIGCFTHLSLLCPLPLSCLIVGIWHI